MKSIINLAIIIGIIFGGYYAYTHYFANTISVKLNQEFSLKKGQTAVVSDSELEVTLENLISAECDKKTECYWGGKGIIFDYKSSHGTDRGLNLFEVFLHKIEVIESDYIGYAKIKITRQ